MRIVLDIGDSAADVPAVLAAMDGDGLELVGVDGSHVGCRFAGIAPAWQTSRPSEHGYYLAAWRRGTPPVWTVSELWFNPDSYGSGWWASRGYLDTRLANPLGKPLPVVAWMPMPVYEPLDVSPA